MSMSGKTVLKTGATSGLGLATALLLAERGAEVVMVGRDRTRSNFMRTEVATCAAGNAPILFGRLVVAGRDTSLRGETKRNYCILGAGSQNARIDGPVC